jgi:hypothetical protein
LLTQIKRGIHLRIRIGRKGRCLRGLRKSEMIIVRGRDVMKDLVSVIFDMERS